MAAGARIRTFDAAQFIGEISDAPMIADYDVVALTCVDGIAESTAIATENKIIAQASIDGVIAANSRIDRKDQSDWPDRSIGLITGTASAQRGSQLTGQKEVLNTAAITKDNVIASSTRNLVAALAPEDNQRQAGQGRINDIVVRQIDVVVVRTLRIEDEESIRLRIEPHRSEERRVGKECRSRWSPYH